VPDTPSTKYAIPRPANEEFINAGPAIIRQALDLIDSLMATAITTTPRPAAGKSGRIHRAADGTISFDTGASWVELARHPHAARHAAGGDDPLTISAAMLGSDIAVPPIGAIQAYAGTTLPGSGRWAWADGSYIDRTVYTAYFAAVGHAFNGGADPGSNLVRLPDLRGRVVVGVDGTAGRLAGPDTIGAAGGEESHALSAGEIPNHAHSGPAHNHGGATVGGGAHAHTFSGYGVPGLSANRSPVASPGGTESNPGASYRFIGFWPDQVLAILGSTSTEGSGHEHGITVDGGGATSAYGGSGAHNNMQPYQVLNYLVRIS
jgi:microcystin-dependent protein